MNKIKARRLSPETPVNLLIEQYPRDTVYRFQGQDEPLPGNTGAENTPRGEISRFSQQSRRRCRLVLRSIAGQMSTVFGLTYPADFPTDGRRVKANIHALVEWLRRRQVGYFWIIEWQERGAPHFHGFLTGHVDRQSFATAWNRIVSADRPEYLGDPAHLEHGTYLDDIKDEEKLASYYTTYMKKLEQKTVPPGYEGVGRYWGSTRSLLHVEKQKVPCTYREASRLLRLERRKYKARCRSWGFKWKWQGQGFTVWDERKLDKGVGRVYNQEKQGVKSDDDSQSEFFAGRRSDEVSQEETALQYVGADTVLAENPGS